MPPLAKQGGHTNIMQKYFEIFFCGVFQNTFRKRMICMAVHIIDYETDIRPRLDAAITSTLMNEVKDAAIDAIEESAQKRVYEAYSPKFYSRRFSAERDSSYSWDVGGNHLIITYTAMLQNKFGGSFYTDDLGDIITSGDSRFHMPFARPWMDEGIVDGMASIENALRIGLESRGF